MSLCRRSGVLGLLVMGCWGVACHNPESYVLGPTPVGFATATERGDGERVLSVTVSAHSIPADGVSRTVITADVAGEADVTSVVFLTTAGTLVGGAGVEGDDARRQTVALDSANRATVDLVSERTVGTATVQVVATRRDNAAAVVQAVRIRFAAVAAEELFRLVVSADAVPADGVASVIVGVEIMVLLGDRRQEVTFSAQDGTLTHLAGGVCEKEAGGRALCVRAGGDGHAVAQLRASKATGEVIVAAEVLGFVRSTVVRFVAAVPE